MDNYGPNVREFDSFALDQNDISMFNRKHINYAKKKLSMPFEKPINSKISDSDFLPYINDIPSHHKTFVRSSHSRNYNNARFNTI